MAKYKIAVIPADGIGVEVVNEGIKVLNKLADNILKIDSGFKLYKMQTLPELDVNIMHEKNLIT